MTDRSPRALAALLLLSLVSLVFPVGAQTAGSLATDPGPRVGPTSVGGPLPGLSQSLMQLFLAGQTTIQEIDSVSATIPGTGLGLGPRFNMDSCGGCHNYPAPGGSSPPVNPQVAVATKDGATNTVPSFVTIDGPIRHAFIKANPNGSPGSGETHLYTIAGRMDALGCYIQQPDFNALAAADQLATHIPPQLYGLGLVEAIADTTIIANLANSGTHKHALGIAGHTGATPGKVGRFDWKGQGTNLDQIASAAYAGEVGVTNVNFPQENDQTPGCQFNPTPEDVGNPNAPNSVDALPDFQKIADFVRYSAPPAPMRATSSISAGRSLFAQIGCALCHTPSLKTGVSKTPALSGKTATLYSDLALHGMGPALADGVVTGNAGPNEFRTAPLWGLGLRLFLLHDGRTGDLLEAINLHASQGNATFPASEANAVIGAFNALSEPQKQNILNFLRSL